MTDADDGAAPKEDQRADRDGRASESLDEQDYADLRRDLLPGDDSDDDDPDRRRRRAIIADAAPSTDLEVALRAELDRQVRHNAVLAAECAKLRRFVSKRKQSYKRKRLDDAAPRKKLSGYNLFVRERFAAIARANEDALRSADSEKELTRTRPASNIASSGRAWSQLSAEEKARYNEMAKPDEDRFEKEAADYVVPEKANRYKRNKTGYNLFFSQHMKELRHQQRGNHDHNPAAERGGAARLVADAWKALSAGEKAAFERQADEHTARAEAAERAAVEPQPPPPSRHGPHATEAGAPPPEGGAMAPAALPPPAPMHHHPPYPLAEEPPPPPAAHEGGPSPYATEGGPPPPPPAVPGGDSGVEAPPDWPTPADYGMHGAVAGPPISVIHHPPGYDPWYPPYDPYGYPPVHYPGGPVPPPPYLPGGPPPPDPGYGPPVTYQGPPPPYA